MRKLILVLGLVVLPLFSVMAMMAPLGLSGLLEMVLLGGNESPQKGSIPTQTAGLAAVKTVYVTEEGNYTVNDAAKPNEPHVEMAEDLQVMMQNAGTCFGHAAGIAEVRQAVWGCDGGGIHQDRKVANTDVYSLHKVAQACDGKTMEVDGQKFDYLAAVAGSGRDREFYLKFFECYGQIADQFIQGVRQKEGSYWNKFVGPIDRTRASDGKFTHVIHWYRDDHKDHYHISAPFIDGVKPSGYSTY